MTPFVFKQVLLSHVLVWGNCYAWIERNQLGQPLALWPITPDRVIPRVLDGKLIYEVRLDGGAQEFIPASDMFHVPGLGFDGIVGYSLVEFHRRTIGIGIAIDEYQSAFFGNNAMPGLVITSSMPMNDKLRAQWKQQIEEYRRGPKNAFRVLALGSSADAKNMNIPPADAETIGTRKVNALEIARILGVPPYLLGIPEDARFRNVEQQNVSFQMRVATFCTRFEEEAHAKLISTKEHLTYTTHMDHWLLARGDLKTIADAGEKLRSNGILNANEVRWRFLQMAPQPGSEGDVYLVPMNHTTVEKLLEDPRPEPEPQPGRPDDDDEDEEDEEDEEEEDENEGAARAMLAELIYEWANETEMRIDPNRTEEDRYMEQRYGKALDELKRRTERALCLMSIPTIERRARIEKAQTALQETMRERPPADGWSRMLSARVVSILLGQADGKRNGRTQDRAAGSTA